MPAGMNGATTMTATIDYGVTMSMRDGAGLRADLWRPAGPGPHPAVLIRTPYGRSLFNADALRPEHCVRRGYACIVQDARGTGDSGGDWAPFQWDQEALDTFDSVEWVAAQPWCDGNVAMAGASYLGIVQWLGAAARPPHLRAVAPGMHSSGELERAASGGAVRLNQLVYWLALTTLEWARYRRQAGHAVDPAVDAAMLALLEDPTPAVLRLPLDAMPQFDIPGLPVDLRAVLAGTAGLPPRYEYERVAVPTLSLGGWYDIYCSATIAAFQAMARAQPDAGHRLIIGPWSHDGHLPGVQGQRNFGPAGYAGFADVPGRHLAFFDEHLKGRRADPVPAVQYFLMGADEWRTADSWPPRTSRSETWYLASRGDARTASGNGRLVREPGVSEAVQDVLCHDPEDPVPSHGGRVASMGRLVGGPLDRRGVEARSDVLCYTGERLDRALDVVGAVTVRLFAATSARDADFAVKLVDVAPDGTALPVAEGLLRARYREGIDAAEPVEPDVTYEYRVDLGDTAWRFHAGHRIRLEIAGSDFPQFDRNAGTGAPIGTDTEVLAARHRIFHNRVSPSSVTCDVDRE
ncbi:CocE/NonD family hydrolase [Glycomyces sp. NPDC021274]|uniref:CocE/NonD family hydrolase n=1 Tax=Glycomyces sp. NPDC021274 TaxID=3155120 RepID=UPI0033C90F1B